MKYVNDTQNYDDIIGLPRHVSDNHKKMPMAQRAAQFAPFAALSGYEDAIEEAARHTEARPGLSEDIKELIDYKLRVISEYSEGEASADIAFFVPDEKKDGGRYESVSGKVERIDKDSGCVIMENKVKIPIKDIIDISGDLFDYLDIGL